MIDDQSPTTSAKGRDAYIRPLHQKWRKCPGCGMKTIKGMPGGRDATCENCGYKDPCCYD